MMTCNHPPVRPVPRAAFASLIAIVTLSLTMPEPVAAGAAPAAPARTPRQAAPIDLSGHWVAMITEEWRFRMIVPAKGDYASVPLTPEARRIADTWDPEADAVNGNACKAYGVGNIMRIPTRLRIDWMNDQTLRMETDAGRQTRMLEFNHPPQDKARTLQGTSRAQWDGNTLKVVTTGMTAGYLRRNGVPYSENAVITEYYVRHAAAGSEWLSVTSVVRDPLYLREEFVTSANFKKLTDASGWNPADCVSEWGPLRVMGVNPFG